MLSVVQKCALLEYNFVLVLMLPILWYQLHKVQRVSLLKGVEGIPGGRGQGGGGRGEGAEVEGKGQAEAEEKGRGWGRSRHFAVN